MPKKALTFIAILIGVGALYLLIDHFYGREIHHFLMETVTYQSVGIMNFFGLPAELSNYAGIVNAITYKNSPILRVMDGCDGMDLLAVYFAFAVALPGPWKHKLWYVPLGLLAVHAFNLVRVMVLVVLAAYDKSVMEFNHKYTFIVLVYGFVFLLWYLWIKKFTIPHARTQVA